MRVDSRVIDNAPEVVVGGTRYRCCILRGRQQQRRRAIDLVSYDYHEDPYGSTIGGLAVFLSACRYGRCGWIRSVGRRGRESTQTRSSRVQFRNKQKLAGIAYFTLRAAGRSEVSSDLDVKTGWHHSRYFATRPWTISEYKLRNTIVFGPRFPVPTLR